MYNLRILGAGKLKIVGMIRKIDELGRIVLPKELRKTFNIQQRDPVEIYVVEDKIMIKKFTEGNVVSGIVRKIDELGRVVLPMEMRKMFDIVSDDAFEVNVEDDNITLKKITVKCIFCGSKSDIVEFMDKRVCYGCIKKIARLK